MVVMTIDSVCYNRSVVFGAVLAFLTDFCTSFNGVGAKVRIKRVNLILKVMTCVLLVHNL